MIHLQSWRDFCPNEFSVSPGFQISHQFPLFCSSNIRHFTSETIAKNAIHEVYPALLPVAVHAVVLIPVIRNASPTPSHCQSQLPHQFPHQSSPHPTPWIQVRTYVCMSPRPTLFLPRRTVRKCVPPTQVRSARYTMGQRRRLSLPFMYVLRDRKGMVSDTLALSKLSLSTWVKGRLSNGRF